ncbi:DUF1801 domain-containing protein [Aeoliella sp. ICT_H6.2]|uniref:DUF1801 domain-containing protein n=1 Tax=Aeoliella straminimaris TaxID=2954799 RepID=A0A9X2FE41_9BACT|nr:DUF1801 domain-containing protein [Aeoliella straminimaris]MCO6046357.1 DUF1801 domain-containing protein [Aeoliella straminimaris]
MNDTDSKVDEYFRNAKQWSKEMEELREVVLQCDLKEELKWRAPCYTYQGSNIAMIGGFKEYFCLSFFKGALLKDSKGVLVKQGENSRSARIVKFADAAEVTKLAATVKRYLREAIEVEKSGLKVESVPAGEIAIPEELQAAWNEDREFEKAFKSLTPGRQRAYVMHFAAAKQSRTRNSRIEKYRERIIDGKGINDCVCGLSKRMPGCDGSHKFA